MLYSDDIERLLLEGYELMCTTYETERELIKACFDNHEVLNVSFIGIYDDYNFKADDGSFEVFDGDMVYMVNRRKEGRLDNGQDI